MLYEIEPRAAHVAGLDVTPRRIRAAVADLTGRIVGRDELPTPGRAAGDTVALVTDALGAACRDAGVDPSVLSRTVVGTPGAFDPGTQRLRYARHLPGWHDPSLLDRLRDALAMPVRLRQRRQPRSGRRARPGAARGSENFVLLWGEEGVGAAIVIGGRLHRGFTGGAGEVGFIPLPGTPLVRNVGVNNAGGFQELAGARAVLALARAHGIRAATAEDAVATATRAVGGEPFLTELAHRLAVGLAAIVAVLDPELVIMSGGVISAGGEPLRDVRAPRAPRPVTLPAPDGAARA